MFSTLAFLIGGQTPIGELIWPPHHANEVPSPGQLPFFILLSVIEALAFGIGISFFIFGWKWVKKVRASIPMALGIYISIGWLLTNWFIHDNLHIHNGPNIQGLLYIEYIFHVTLIIAGLILAYSFISIFKKSQIHTTKSEKHSISS